jgi:hypothetical protein
MAYVMRHLLSYRLLSCPGLGVCPLCIASKFLKIHRKRSVRRLR